MTFSVVSSGTTTSNVVLNNGDMQQVTSSGTTISTVINSGGTQDVYGNNHVPGVASSTIINDGGLQDVSAGVALNTLVNAGGTQIVENNAVATGDVISSTGATVVVSAGGVTSMAALGAGGIEYVGVGGNASNTTVRSGGLLSVSGGYANGAVVSSGGSAVAMAYGTDAGLTVFAGGVAIASGGTDYYAVVTSGGLEIVSGGTASSTTIYNGGVEQVLANGYTANVAVSSGGSQTIMSAGQAYYTSVDNGGTQTISSGGTTSGYVNSGGVEDVLDGGTATSQTIQAGGIAFIEVGGSATLSIVNGGSEAVLSGGSIDSTRLLAGNEVIYAGGFAADVIVTGGTLIDIGVANSTVMSAGAMVVSSGGIASGTYISGGALSISSGGSASATYAINGTETIYAGGLETGATITGAAVQTVIGSANSTTLNNGAHQYVAGGQTSSTTVSYGGVEIIQAGGIAVGATINNGGVEIVSSGGTASSVTVNSGGIEYILSGGGVDGAVVSGGSQVISAGAAASGTSLVGTGATQTVSGAALATTINSGAVETVFGSTIGTIILGGGQEIVLAGGVDSAAAVAGGLLTVSGGSTTGAFVSFGGIETLLSGSANTTTVVSAGTLAVSGGVASGSIVSSGGALNVVSGTASGTLLSGGIATLFSAGIAADALIAGGTETISAGGLDLRATVASGGTLNVTALGVASATVVTLGGTENVLSAGTARAAVLSGGIQNLFSGAVASATQIDAGSQQVVLDGAMASASVVSNAEQTVASGGIATLTIVQAGALQVVDASGSAGVTTVTSGGMQLVNSGGTATNTFLSGHGTLLNHGTTSATSGTAVSGVGGSAYIANDGVIIGTGVGNGIGIVVAGGTVSNAGMIQGLSGTAIQFGGTTTNRLVVTSASVISGLVSATAAAANTLELTGAPLGATLSGYTAQYLGFQTLQVDSGSTWDIAGTNTLNAIVDGGVIQVGTGDNLRVNGAVTSPNGPGAGFSVAGNGILSLNGAVDSGETISLSGTRAELILGAPGTFGGTVDNFARGDIIDLSTVPFAGTSASLAAGQITVQNGGATYAIALGATISGSALKLVADANGKTELLLAPPVTEALATDTGISPTDRLTNVGTLTGAADPNATVVLTEGGIGIGSAIANGAGLWSFTPTLADGAHTVVATDTDAGGNVGSATLAYTLDTHASPTPTLALTSASDSNFIGDHITNVNTPTLTGTGTTGDTITVSNGGSVIGTATVANGTWAFPFTTPLADSVYIFNATDTDPAGNVSGAATLIVQIDTVAPMAPPAALALTSDSGTQGDGFTNDTRPAITGTAELGDVVTLYNGAVALGSATVAADGTYSVGPTDILADGGYTLTTKETDAAGNTSIASAPVSFTIDTTRPAATSSPALASASDSGNGDGYTRFTQPAITGTGIVGDIVTLYDQGVAVGTATVQQDNTFSVTPTYPLADGAHSLTTTQTDFVGNVSLATSPLALHTKSTAPVASALVLAPGSDSGVLGDGITKFTQPAITGTGTVGDTITLYEAGLIVGTGLVAATGSFSVAPTLALAPGSYSFQTTETDLAANVSALSTALPITIQTAAPTATSTPVLDPASDSGLPDSTTNVTRPVITGTATIGDTVTLYDNGTSIGTVMVALDGTFAVTPTSPLGNGLHNLTTTQTDFVGNTSTASSPVSVTIDTTPPAATSSLALAPATDSGNGDGYTKFAQPTITGTGIVGDIVTLYNYGVAVGNATVQQDNTFSVTPTHPLVDGAHSLTTTQTDFVGNVSLATLPLALITKTVAPIASALVLAPASDSGLHGDNTTNVRQPFITGTGTVGDTITLYEAGSSIGTGIVAADGTFSVAPTTALTPGLHDIQTTETDLAANVSAMSNALPITIDITPPAVPLNPILSPTSDSGVLGDGITNVTRPVITGSGTAGDTVTLYNNGLAIGTSIVAADGTFAVSPTSPFGNGLYSLTTAQTDAVGNTSAQSAPISVTVATLPPAGTSSLALAAGSDSGHGDGYTNSTQPAIVGFGAPGDTITLYDQGMAVGTTTVQPNGSFFVTPTTPLIDGAHSFTTKQTDPVGNISISSAPLALITKSSAPTASTLVLAPGSDSGVHGDGITNVTQPTITGTGVAGDTINLYDNGGPIGTATVAADGTFSVTPTTALAPGSHSFQTTETDLAANVSALSAALPITIDTAPPVVTSALTLSAASDSGLQGDDITSAVRPAITGTGIAGETVTLYDGGASISTTIVAADGTFSVAPTNPLGDGLHSFTTAQTNAVGNTSAPSAPLSVTVDTVASLAPAALTLSPASDSGVPGDGITNVIRPAITGTGNAGDTITLYDGPNAVGTIMVAADGTFSVLPSAGLSSGLHALTAKATDPAGNVSVASLALPIAIDLTPPATPTVLGVDPSSDSGVSHSDGITNVTKPTIDGIGAPGSIVTLYDGRTALGTATVRADGTYAVTPTSPLAEGPHNLTTSLTSPAGNVSAISAPLFVVIDTTAPVITERLVADTGLSNTDKITSNPSLAGVGDPYAIVTLTEGGAVLGTTRTDRLGAWAFTPTGLPDGAHTVGATESVTDTAGNAGTSSLNFTLDTTAPVAPAAVALDPTSDTGVPGDGITNVTRPAITGTGTPGNKVTLFDAGVAVGTATVTPNGTFSIAPTNVLPDGLHNLTTTQTNPAGNQSPGSAVVSFTIVTVPPAVTSALALDPGSNSGVPGGNTTNVMQPVITGSGAAGDVLTLYDNGIAIGTTIVALNGTFAASPSNPLANGPHSLTATQTDGIGNISALSSPLALTIDTIAPQPPSAPILTAGSNSGVPGDGITNVATPVIAGTAEAGSVVQLYDGTAAIGTAVANPITGAWSIIATSPLSEGPDSLTATSTDAAGNVSALSSALNVTLDTVAPAMPTLVLDPASDSGVPGDGVTSVTNPLITGAAEAGSTVRLYDGVFVVGVATADPVTGAWSIAPTTPLVEGSNSLTATTTDAAGNVSALSGPISVMLDTIAPLAPTLGLSVSSDSGVSGDGITNVATPTLSGTAERGSTVRLYNGAVTVGATVADPLTGAWSVALTGALSEGANSLTASSIDTAGNVSARSAPVSVTLDTAAPTVSMVAATPSTADLGIGGVATLTLTMSKAVTVTTAGGTPTLSLSDGGTASYISGSGTTALLFSYTVLPGQSAADLTVTGSSLNGSAIADVAGNAADLAAAQTNPAGVLQVDTVVPTVTSVTAVPGAGAVGAGQVVTLRLGMSKTVSVTGTPTLSLNDGGIATYDPTASTANSLAFITTVAPGQNALNLGITATNLNGATLTDAAGNLADLSAAPGSLTGPLQVDTTPPTVNSMTSSPASGTLAAGQTVTFTLGTTKNVAVTGGTPTLALNDGGVATYDAAASGPNNLVFDYIVGPVDNTESLAVTGAGLHGAAILDEAGNALDLTSAANFPLTLQVDTITPLVSGVSFSPTDGPVLTGQTVTLRLATNDAVTVAGGIPTLTLSDGGIATYNPAASTATSLAFVYTVGSSDASPALGVSALNLNGAVVANGAGTIANLAGAVGTIPNALVINTGVHPFLPLVSSNPDPAAILTVKAAVLASNGGSYGNLGIGSIGADGFTYTVTGTSAQVNAALAGVLLVRPAGGPPVTGLTATVSDQNGSLTSRLSNTGVFGSTLVATAPGETVSAGMGPDTLTAGASGNVLVGGPGHNVLVGSNGGGTLLGGTGQSVFFSVGGPTRIVGGSIGDTISAAAGDVTIVTSMAGHSLVGLGSGTALVNGQGADTIVGGSGSAVVGAGANSLVGLTVGSATVSAADGSTVITGSGPALVAASNTGILMFQGPGAATFIGGSGASTVVGGSGSHGAFFGGTGGGLFSGGSGGNNVIVGGQQATTILGGGGGDLMFAVGAAGTVITAGAGNETLQGGYSTGNDTFFAGPGQDLIGLGSGHDVVFAGSGAATIIGGSGQDVVAFANGRAGGTDTLYNFKPGTDVISLQGYAVGEAAHALAGATTTPSTATQAASVTVTLSDKTQITFQGIGSLNAQNFA